MDEKIAKIGEVAMGQGKIAGDEVTDLVYGPEESREVASNPADDGRQAETPKDREEAPRKEAEWKRDLDDSGKDLKGPVRKPARASKAEKRRVEEEENSLEKEHLEEALRASREHPALKRQNDDEDRGGCEVWAM